MNSVIANIRSVSLSSITKGIQGVQDIIKEEFTVDNIKVKKSDQKKDETPDSDSKVISLEDAKKLAKESNKILENVQRNLEFKVDDTTKQVVMTIVDKESGEVIRQLPSEEALELAKRMLDADGDPGGIVEDSA